MVHIPVRYKRKGLPMARKSHLTVVSPNNQNRTVTPTRPPNAELRSREYLTATEVDKLIAATKGSRYPQRDATMILTVFRHGLRATEACELEWSQIDFDAAEMHIRRAKNGKPAVHPIRGDELRALRKLRAGQEPHTKFVFTSERGAPFTTDAMNRLIKRLGAKTKLGFPVHIHMLRHSCGYKLANDGHDTRSIQDYLGHRSIQHTVRYTELSPTRFRDFWRD
jgi:type 1 fimbriae regulatory protein FimB/type 1 fimbriae regulatory protein FimE